MTTNQYEENQNQERNRTLEQLEADILAELTPTLKHPESQAIAIAEVKRALADTDSFRFEVEQNIIDLDSSIKSTRHEVALHDKALQRAQDRLSTHYKNRRITKRIVDDQKLESQTISDDIEQIDEEIEMMEVYPNEDGNGQIAGGETTLPQRDRETIITSHTRVRTKRYEEEDEELGSYREYFADLI